MRRIEWRAGASGRLALISLGLLAVMAAPALAGPEDVPKPKVEGPVLNASSRPFFSTDIDLERLGYREDEFFFSGSARRYGSGNGTPLGEMPYKSRIVVRRPERAADFNGVVVVELYNTTAGYDQEFEWFVSHEHFTREGYAWVGVTAQSAGANNLRNWNSRRYGSISIPDENLSHDVFSQGARALQAREGVDPLGGLVPEIMIAAGHSQSTIKLADYHNHIQPQHQLFQGFMLRGSQSVHKPHKGTKMFRSYSESDKSYSSDFDNNPDTDDLRIWEHAGVAHVSYKEAMEAGPLNVRDRGSVTPAACFKPRYTRTPFNHPHNAAYHHLVRWIKGEGAPPIAPRLEYGPDGVMLQRDEDGFSVGGLRTPELQVPRALDSGDNYGGGYCFLYGAHEPFDEEKLRALYPTRADYVGKHNAALRKFHEDGFILPADARISCKQAREVDFGWKGAAAELPAHLEACSVAAPDTPGRGSPAGSSGEGTTTARRLGLRLAIRGVKRGKGAQRLQRSPALRRGIRVAARCKVLCTLRLSLRADKRTVERLGVGNPLSRPAKATFKGRRAIRLRFKRAAAAALRKSRSTRMTLRVDATDAQERVAVRTMKLRMVR